MRRGMVYLEVIDYNYVEGPQPTSIQRPPSNGSPPPTAHSLKRPTSNGSYGSPSTVSKGLEIHGPQSPTAFSLPRPATSNGPLDTSTASIGPQPPTAHSPEDVFFFDLKQMFFFERNRVMRRDVLTAGSDYGEARA